MCEYVDPGLGQWFKIVVIGCGSLVKPVRWHRLMLVSPGARAPTSFGRCDDASRRDVRQLGTRRFLSARPTAYRSTIVFRPVLAQSAFVGETMSFGYDGDRGLGDRLLAAVLRGEKTATSSLAVEYLSGEPLPQVGERLTLVDHAGRPHGVVETTRVRIIPLHLVGDDVAWDEGEGFVDAQQWRSEHLTFWAEVADLVRSDAGDPTWQLRDAEPVVVHWFRLLAPAAAGAGLDDSQ